MSIPESIEMARIIQALRQTRHNIIVSSNFKDQMEQIQCLLANDSSGLVSTLLDFMINTSSTPINIETTNDTLDNNIQEWQEFILNKDINIDIPRGLRELSTEYFRERWTSSFIGLKVIWEEHTFGGDTWTIPAKMFFVDGSALRVEQPKDKAGRLDSKTYTLTDKKNALISDKESQSVIIRKPYNAWYSLYPTPFLVRRGILFNALLKKAIIDKQADILTQIIPYLFLIKSGNDLLAKENLLAGEPEMKKLKDSLIEAIKESDMTGELGKLIASLNYDVNMEHFIPDFKKFMDIDITKACDKNILAGFGMIEVQGFAKNREETMLNPKVMVEEIYDAVNDWADMIKEVMLQMLDRNRTKFPKLTLNKIKVVPGLIKAFLTEDMKTAMRNAYDRGNISRQSYIENTLNMDFELEIERVTKEKARKLDDTLYPPVIQNFEQYGKISDNPDLENQNKKPGTPEANNFKNAEIEEKIIAPYNNIDELPPSVKDNLPVAAKIIFLRVFNQAIKDNKSEEDAFKLAWGVVKKSFYKDDDGKWKKRKD